MAPDIPPELKCMVLENLYDDKRTLSACSVLAQAWQHPARAVLFRSITLRAGRIPTKPHHLFSRLQVPNYEVFTEILPPLLLNAVHDLDMSGLTLSRWGALDYMGEFDREREVDDDEPQWDDDDQPSEEDILWTTLQLDVILRIIDALPKLKALSLSHFMFKSINVHDIAPVRLKKIALHSFAVRGQDDILKFFDALGADEIVLDVFRPMAVGAGQPGPVYTPPGFALASSFEFLGCHRSLRVLQAMQITPPPLTSLAVHIQTLDELHEVDQVLKSVVPSLTRLFLDMCPAFVVGHGYVVMFGKHSLFCINWPSTQNRIGDTINALKALNLASLNKLTHFELGARIGSPGADTDITLQLIGDILLSMARFVPISHLTLHFDFPLRLLESVIDQFWSALGRSPALFAMKSRGLQRVELAVTHSLDGIQQTISASDRKTIKGIMRLDFPSIIDILNISFL